MSRAFEVQGHRGARGLAPENTLAGFEIAIDVGVASIETDVHLTLDDVPILFHDERIGSTLVRSLPLEALRAARIVGPEHGPTPVAEHFARSCGTHPHGIPTLAEFIAFVSEYAGALGEAAGKSDEQRAGADSLIFDIELKRVPFHPEHIGDGFDGTAPALMERQVVAAIVNANVLERTRVRSFDHRSVRAIRQLAPGMQTAILIDGTAPVDIAALLDAVDVYCPDYHFVDEQVVRQVHDAGKRIVPYTVNDSDAWQRLVDWGVDGVTTDYPDRLRAWLDASSTR